jgi:2-dehydropantoate 2-reductase
MQHIVIVGAGAMGCLFAARLAEAGVSVMLVDVDPKRLALLNSEGIVLSDDDGERTVPVNAALAGDVAAPADLVLVFTKGMHSAAAARSVAHLADGNVYALTLQNGIGNAEAIAEVFTPARVLMGVTDLPADLVGTRRIESHGQGHIRLGGFAAEAQPAAQAVAALLNRGRLNAEADEAIQAAVWEKVAFNAALNALATVTGLTVGGMDEAPGRRIAAAIVGEVVETAAALGISLDRSRINARVAFALANHRNHKASMLQDRLAGRPTEIESINGAVVRVAERLGIGTPVTATLADLVRLLEMEKS